jgi:arylsulfatase A-like enzyme/Flp pilus assembly protein TadD
VTGPSISTILTGTLPPFHGVRGNKTSKLPENVQSLAEDFAEHGYRTKAIVASFIIDARSGLGQGFGEYDDNFGPFTIYNPLFQALKKDLDHTQRRADEITRLAISWLEAHRRERFFLFLHYFDPHDIYDPPPPYDRDIQSGPYYGEVGFADQEIGALLSSLRKLRLDSKTLIVLVSDHGEALGEHGENSHGFFLYGSTLKIPLIYSCPGFVPGGLVVEGLARGVDVRPTILGLLGLPCNGPVQGRNLASSVLRGESTGVAESYCETYHTRLAYAWSELTGVETPEWKYIRAPRSELYDLQSDPAEERNLCTAERPKGQEMSQLLDHMLHELTPPGALVGKGEEATSLDRDTREKLKSLGYIDETLPPTPGEAKALPDPKDMIVVWSRKQEVRRHNRAATVMIAAGDYQRAVEELNKALTYDPHDAGAHYNLGQIYVKMGKPEAAIGEFRKAISGDPKMAKAYTNLAAALYLRGEREEAVSLWKKSIQVDPTYEVAYRNLGSINLALQDYSSAAALFRRLLQHDPKSSFAHYGLGLSYWGSGNRTSARVELETFLRSAPPGSKEAQEARRLLGRE